MNPNTPVTVLSSNSESVSTETTTTWDWKLTAIVSAAGIALLIIVCVLLDSVCRLGRRDGYRPPPSQMRGRASSGGASIGYPPDSQAETLVMGHVDRSNANVAATTIPVVVSTNEPYPIKATNSRSLYAGDSTSLKAVKDQDYENLMKAGQPPGNWPSFLYYLDLILESMRNDETEVMEDFDENLDTVPNEADRTRVLVEFLIWQRLYGLTDRVDDILDHCAGREDDLLRILQKLYQQPIPEGIANSEGERSTPSSSPIPIPIN